MPEHSLSRRKLLAASAAAGVVVAGGVGTAARAHALRVPGVQLYTLRDSMAKDVATTLQAVAGMGYREVEFAGYFGHTAREIRDMLARFGLTSPSAHVNVSDVLEDPQAVVAEAAEAGHQYVTIAWIEESDRQSIADYQRWADVANRLGEASREHGMRAAYHNHDFEFRPIGGVVPFDILLKETDPALLDFELDFFWVQKAGKDIRKVLAMAPERMTMSHIKDIDADGNMVSVGAGTIDFAGILAEPVAASIRHCFVEHDNPDDPFRSVAFSHYTLKSILESAD